MSTQAGILKVIHAVADIPNDPAPDESLFDSGTLDSFPLPDLHTGLEQESDVKIPDADLVPERSTTHPQTMPLATPTSTPHPAAPPPPSKTPQVSSNAASPPRAKQ